MNIIKLWLIHKLGGISYSELPIDIQQIILNRWVNRSMDFYSKSLFKVFDNGFKPPQI